MSADDVPLICDPVPGPARLVIGQYRYSRAVATQLRTDWERRVLTGRAKSMWYPAEMTDLEWPDAEFCAA